MRYASILILLVISVACHHNETKLLPSAAPLNARDTLIILPDSLGSVVVTVPKRYDTFFYWTHFSDCNGCGKRKYRFQPSSLPIIKESGWIWDGPVDSVERFTIEHSDYTEKRGFNLTIDDSSKHKSAIRAHPMNIEILKSDPTTDYVIGDTLKQINGSWFSIIFGSKYDSSKKIFSKYVVAISDVRLNEIRFRFELLTKQNDSINKYFIRNSLECLNRLTINEGK